MEIILQDLRYSAQMLVRRPGFSAIVVAVLAVGIGSNSAVFSVINSIMFQPLPFKNPEQLVLIHRNNEKLGKVLASPPDFLDWQSKNRVFEQIATFRNQGFILAGHEEPERLLGVAVSASLFPLLGVDPIKGRTFLPQEEKADAENVVILSYGLWQRRFGGDPEVIGKQIRLTDNTCTIIGVMPAGYEFPRLLYGVAAELWMPLRFNASQLSNWRDYTLPVIGRLKPGVSIEQAQTDMQIIAPQPEQQYTATEGEYSMRVTPLKEEVVGKIRQPLLILLGAVGLVLLIACANAANLLLARAVTRQKEIAVRVAVGASRNRIIRQLLTESLLLAMTGGALGIVLAYWGIKLIEMGSPDTISRIGEIKIDYTVLIFTLTLAILTGAVFGLVPALQASKPNLDELCRQASARLSGGRGLRRLHSILVVFELVIVLVLLVSAGLLVNSFIRLQRVDPGFNPDRLLTVSISLPRYKYTDVRRIASFYQQALQQIKAIPGVESVGAITGLPIQGGGGSTFFSVKGYKSELSEGMRTVDYQVVSPDYFTAMGIPLLNGQFFSERDAEGALKVAIIDEIMARRFWPDEDPVGQVINIKEDSLYIVGVVGQVKHNGLEREAVPIVYVPYLQRPIASMILVIRSAHDPLSLTASVRGAILSVDKDQPVSSVSTMQDIFDHSMGQRRFSMLLLTVFVGFAVLLAIVGIYSVTAYSVRSRTQEIGIRIALGAQPRDILKLVLSQGLKLALIGLGTGTVIAIAVTSFLSSLLYEISATDPATFIESSLLLFAVTLLASFLPARRAARIRPVEALRYE